MIPSEARGAWRELEGRLRPYVARRVASPDAEDVLQDVLVRVHRGIGTLDDDERFGPWVYRVASNTITDHLRSRARHAVALGKDDASDAEVAASHDDDLEAELGECVALFVARLPSPYRQAVTLTELEGLTQKDAAEMLGVSVSGMKSRVQRGRERVRRMFTECCELTLDARGSIVECTPRSLDHVPEDCRDAARSWQKARGV